MHKSKIHIQKRKNATQRKIGRNTNELAARPQKQPKMRRVYNQLFAIFPMSHNVYFTTYIYLKPGYINNRPYIIARSENPF